MPGSLSLVMAVMAGAGFAKIIEKMKGRIKVYSYWIALAVIVLISVELYVVSPSQVTRQPWEVNFDEQLGNSYLLQNVSNDTELSRLHLYGEDFVGVSLAKYAVEPSAPITIATSSL